MLVFYIFGVWDNGLVSQTPIKTEPDLYEHKTLARDKTKCLPWFSLVRIAFWMAFCRKSSFVVIKSVFAEV